MATKTVNLDNYKTTFEITLDGKVYKQHKLSVGHFIDGGIQKKIVKLSKGNLNPQKKISLMVDVVVANTEIPKDVLLKQDIEILHKLVQILQGVDPTEISEQSDTAEASDTEKK